jgi:hypothetical protein
MRFSIGMNTDHTPGEQSNDERPRVGMSAARGHDCRTAMNEAVRPAGWPLCGLARSTDPTRDST